MGHSTGGGSASPRLSIVTAGLNEAGNVDPFLSEALQAIEELGVTAEIIYIDDASTDGTSEKVRLFSAAHPLVPIRLIVHATRQGITAAMAELFSVARGELLCVLPSDLESSPARDIPALYRALEPRVDVVVGCRRNRADGKAFSSSIYNFANRVLFGVTARDANWIKLIRREKLAGLTLRSNWHRFLLPMLAHRGCTVKEVTTDWHPRSYGKSKFGLKRVPGAIADLIAVKLHLVRGGKA